MPKVVIGHINHRGDRYPLFDRVHDTFLKRQVLDLHVVFKLLGDFLDLLFFFDLVVAVLAIELSAFFKLRFHKLIIKNTLVKELNNYLT